MSLLTNPSQTTGEIAASRGTPAHVPSAHGHPAHVYIVDDDTFMLESLTNLVASLGLVPLAFSSAADFLDAELVGEPCCVVLDLQLPGLGGLEVQSRLNLGTRRPPIVFLTGHGDIASGVRAVKAGAVEFLTKPFRGEELSRAIKDAIELDRAAVARQKELLELRIRYDSLTPREREVMARVVAGLLNKQIAAEFSTAESTVKEQRGRVMTKMKAESVQELVRLATRLEL